MCVNVTGDTGAHHGQDKCTETENLEEEEEEEPNGGKQPHRCARPSGR